MTRALLCACPQFVGVFQLTGSPVWSNVRSILFLPLFLFLVDSSGREKELLLSRAKDGFSNPSFCMESRGSERGSDTDGGLPDVFLDDLANHRFHVQKRPEGFISQHTSFNSFKYFLLIC